MKKIFTVFVLGAALSLGAAAQNWQDALMFTENNYSGTARGVAMGNALTAVGGDPGSIVFNPAGSSVAAYTQSLPVLLFRPQAPRRQIYFQVLVTQPTMPMHAMSVQNCPISVSS